MLLNLVYMNVKFQHVNTLVGAGGRGERQFPSLKFPPATFSLEEIAIE